jgi:phospholipase/carboxylesterase
MQKLLVPYVYLAMFTSAALRATSSSSASGRLSAWPPPPGSISFPAMPSGLQEFKVNTVRNPLVYVPRSYDPQKPTATIVTLHGAGGDAKNGVAHLIDLADSYNILLVSPSSRRSTWDAIRSMGGLLGPDLDHINATLTEVFNKYNVDFNKLALSGFSDGASYALTLGLPNGDLFSHIIAFSPGFMRPPSYVGKPKIYISHGVYDSVLPVSLSRGIVPQLQQLGYNVTYDEFDGHHIVPVEVAKEGIEFLTRQD